MEGPPNGSTEEDPSAEDGADAEADVFGHPSVKGPVSVDIICGGNPAGASGPDDRTAAGGSGQADAFRQFHPSGKGRFSGEAVTFSDTACAIPGVQEALSSRRTFGAIG